MRTSRTIRASVSLAILVATLLSCTRGLSELLTYEALASEEAALYLGYNEDGYGIARLGVATGVLEIFRDTVSKDNINGCALSMDPRAIEWPAIYYTAEAPDRILHLDYLGLGAPEGDATGSLDRTNCLRAIDTGEYIDMVSSTETDLLGVPAYYIGSFDMTGQRWDGRVYYLGIRVLWPDPLPEPLVSAFAVVAVDTDGQNQDVLYTIGHYVESNLLYLDGYLYWVDQVPPQILRIKADGTEDAPTTLLTPTAEPYAVAVDPALGTIYWYEFGEQSPRRIMKAEPGETAGTVLLNYTKQIDPNGFLFYRW